MATFTLFEYATLSAQGEPLRPEFSRQVGLAFGVAVRLQAETKYFKVVPDADARIRVSDDGSAATTGDPKIYGDIGDEGPIKAGARPYVYLIAA
jgi:hypothetical protein